ncbi:GIY-YIG nuclease family protein [Candidatus Roizmanbacteria bacterium]|nr:GIY-YIG nuclease family protein [Candidatus Roizmanbacteria bacterium]
MLKPAYIYIVSNTINGTVYIGVTSNLIKRIWEHKNNVVKGFTQQYALHNLVYFEMFTDISQAIAREKQLKHWNRLWKLKLINEANPQWRDLYEEITK